MSYGATRALLLSGAGASVADRERDLWKLVAFACRYGHIPLSEALGIDRLHLRSFVEALASIVKEENATARD